MAGLFGDDFEINLNKKPTTKSLLDKLALAETDTDSDEIRLKILNSKTYTLADKVSIINTRVLTVLGKQKNNVLVITDKDTLNKYIDKAIANGRIAVDTETNNSTDPVTCKLMGLCLYTPNEKQVYIPVNHVNIDTRKRLNTQLTEADCAEALQRIIDAKTYVVMHNGKFDYEVLKCTCGVEVVPNWDTLIGARLIDENKYSEKRTSLKYIYTTEIDPDQAKYDIGELFENVPYEVISPDIFALYAATDSLMTDKLYLWEMPFFEGEENKKLRWLAENIEMPIVQVTAEMELTGVCIDQEFGKRLNYKYTEELNKIDTKITAELNRLKPVIDAWRLTPEANSRTRQYEPKKTKKSRNEIEEVYDLEDESGRRYKLGKAAAEQLGEQINLASPTQMAVLFYDILGAPVVDKKKPRGTGEDELKAIAEKRPDIKLCSLLLERRGIVKLITTYIDVIPELAKHWPDGRIRYRLMSMGTDTGRFASGGKFKFLDENDEPVVLNSINSQNIPSHNPEIRMLFKAAPGYKIVGSDYSGQELKLATFLSQDKKLLKSYEEGKDVYAMIASEMFGYPYEECLEFYPEGTELEIDGQKIIAGKKTHVNKAGKERRAVGKTMVLAGNYGMGGGGAGSLMGKTAKEGKELLDRYFTMFDGLKNAIDKSKEAVKKHGYVEDVAGRRRRLPDIFLPPYEVRYKDEEKTAALSFNPFLQCKDRPPIDAKLKSYLDRTKLLKSNKEYEDLAKQAAKEKNSIIIQANTGRIAQAERQCFNAMIQGSAGTLTKKAMIDIFNDEELKSYDTHLIITVHDEVLVECKEEFAERVEKRLPEIMINAALELGITAPAMQCDPYCVSRWYADAAAVAIRDEFKKLENGDAKKNIMPLSRDEALKQVCKNHIEVPEAAIKKSIETGCDLDF